jgi:hypothetical protein
MRADRGREGTDEERGVILCQYIRELSTEAVRAQTQGSSGKAPNFRREGEAEQ